MIEVKNVSKRFPQGKTLFRQLNFSIGKAASALITGPSGAGKTSLLHLIYGFSPPYDGEVLFKGKSVYHMSSFERAMMRREMGFVFQDFRLLAGRTVDENIRLPLEIQNVSSKVIDKEVEYIVRRLGLSELRHEDPETLSGGEQQRVAVARAIIHRPEWLFADEPTGNLDPKSALDVMSLLQEVNQSGTAVVVATHDENLVRNHRGVCIRLEHGLIREQMLC
jgi:cell division transport system ATP-binding protein